LILGNGKANRPDDKRQQNYNAKTLSLTSVKHKEDPVGNFTSLIREAVADYVGFQEGLSKTFAASYQLIRRSGLLTQ